MENFMHKLLAIVADPDVAVPFWGAIGGVIRALFRRPHTWLAGSASIILAAMFAHWFTHPLIQYLGLPSSSDSGVGAVLGIASYEIVRMLATGSWTSLVTKSPPSNITQPTAKRRPWRTGR